MAWVRLRTVILDHPAQQTVDKLAGEYHRFAEAWEAFEWLIARDPNKGVRKQVGTRAYRLYVQASDPLAGTPEIWIVYSHDDDQVVVHGVNAKDAIAGEQDAE